MDRVWPESPDRALPGTTGHCRASRGIDSFSRGLRVWNLLFFRPNVRFLNAGLISSFVFLAHVRSSYASVLRGLLFVTKCTFCECGFDQRTPFFGADVRYSYASLRGSFFFEQMYVIQMPVCSESPPPIKPASE